MEDSEIVELYLARREQAVAETAKRYGARLRKLAYSVLEEEAAAEECENDAYLEAWNAIPPAEPRTYLYAFLARITRHLAIDRCRNQARKKRSARLEELTAELADCVSGPEDVERSVEARLVAEAVSRFLRALPEEKRDMFLRRYWYCDSIGSIAGRLRCGESRVKTALHRTRKELKDYLEKEGYTV